MLIGDVTLDGIQAGLRGLNVRRAAAEDAVANVETPGYTARTVQFEDALASAIRGGSPFSARVSVNPTADASLPNGNNVQLDRELVTLTDTALRQQLLVAAANHKFNLLRTVITG
ncbi:MAG: hypothetical protein R2698_03020 [Microthrixaceae bacterium]